MKEFEMVSRSFPVADVGNHHDLAPYTEVVSRVVQTMQEQLDEALSLKDMADIAGFSPYHFNRIFRKITGIPPTQFLYSLRLQRAKQLLLTTQLSVTDICFEVGYNSLGTFTRRFTELVSVSPTRLRTLHKDPFLFLQEPGYRRFIHSFHDHAYEKGCLTGQVYGRIPYSGFIFVAVFPIPIPQGQPVGCAILKAPGPYQISSLTEGYYYVFSAAYSQSFEPEYVGVGCQPILITSQPPLARMDITLRPVLITDPPILIAAPYLFAKHADKHNGAPS
jgi:AraC family transcriptional regulator